MRDQLTANRVRSMAIGIMFPAGFGMAWFYWSLALRQEIGPVTATVVWVCGLPLIFAAIGVRRQATRWPEVSEDPKKGRMFGAITAAEWIAIVAAVIVCGRLHWEAYLPAAVTTIVGLHYFPLARLFRNPMHYVTGTMLVAWAAASAAMMPAGEMGGWTALGSGVILWISAAVTLVRARQAMRAESGSQLAVRSSWFADRVLEIDARGSQIAVYGLQIAVLGQSGVVAVADSSDERTRCMMPR